MRAGNLGTPDRELILNWHDVEFGCMSRCTTDCRIGSGSPGGSRWNRPGRRRMSPPSIDVALQRLLAHLTSPPSGIINSTTTSAGPERDPPPGRPLRERPLRRGGSPPRGGFHPRSGGGQRSRHRIAGRSLAHGGRGPRRVRSESRLCRSRPRTHCGAGQLLLARLRRRTAHG